MMLQDTFEFIFESLASSESAKGDQNLKYLKIGITPA
jgi:hypothetical protein